MASNLSLPSLSKVQVDWLVIGVSVAAVCGCLIMGWMALQPDQYAAEIVASEEPTPTPVGVPTLKLNQNHQRQGAEIEVDPSEIGKENPFQ